MKYVFSLPTVVLICGAVVATGPSRYYAALGGFFIGFSVCGYFTDFCLDRIKRGFE